MRSLFANEYLVIDLDGPRGIVRARRTATPYPSVAAAIASFEGVAAALQAVDRSRVSLLVDVRGIVGRNDPDFERTVGSTVARTFSGFRARATLVRSAAGRLQIHRLDRESGRPLTPVFVDEEDALEHLREAL